jgi:hypothetical protein
MSYYVVCWFRQDGMTAITLDTTSGEHIILVHSDQQIAMQVMNVASRTSHQAVAIMTLDMPKEKALNVLRQHHDGREELAFPEDPRYLIMLNQVFDIR